MAAVHSQSSSNQKSHLPKGIIYGAGGPQIAQGLRVTFLSPKADRQTAATARIRLPTSPCVSEQLWYACGDNSKDNENDERESIEAETDESPVGSAVNRRGQQ